MVFHGVVPFLKPPGMTSHDAVGFVRRLANTKRVGHTGTLDPAAAGVLVLCVGNATKLVPYLQSGRKTYIAEAAFGWETDSLDATGEIISRADAGALNEEAIRAILPSFRGTIQQTPPLFSAIKQNGKKLYELAHAGETTEIAAREVEILRLELTRFDASENPRAMLHIECGSGTYIRSLVRDIGRALGCFATMTFLVRTENGGFSIDDARTGEELQRDFTSALTPFRVALESCAARTIEDDEVVTEYLAGRTRRSAEAQMNYRVGNERLLFVDATQKYGLLCDGHAAKLFHLVGES